MTKKKKSRKIIVLNSENGGETATGFNFRVGYTYRADVTSPPREPKGSLRFRPLKKSVTNILRDIT
jgi:hypothetical protein